MTVTIIGYCEKCGAPLRARKADRGAQPKVCAPCKLDRRRELAKKYAEQRRERKRAARAAERAERLRNAEKH